MNTTVTLHKHIVRIKLNGGYTWFLVHAPLLNMTNLLATFEIATIVSHKTSLVRSKGGLAFLGDIAQSLFVERCPLATST